MKQQVRLCIAHANKRLNSRKRQATTELLQQRMAMLEGIERGEMAVAEGRVVRHAEAKSRMAQWLKLEKTGFDVLLLNK